MARVVRPASEPKLFTYLAPLLAASRKALDALPPDGPADPKILMRVDWGVGEPLLPTSPQPSSNATVPGDGAASAPSQHATSDGEETREAHDHCGTTSESGFLKRALVKRAGSLAAPQKRLKRSMNDHATAPLTGPHRHFINEVEIHPGYYVDWDETPDETFEPLAQAYGEYISQVLTGHQADRDGAAASAHPA